MGTLLVLGGTSAVALAYAREAAIEGRDIHIVGRNKTKLEANRKDLDARGTGVVTATVMELGNTNDVADSWKKLQTKTPNINHLLLAYGVLGDLSLIHI